MLPIFIHRVRGPFHRIVIEPPIVVDAARPEGEAVRDGMARFAELLARHITQDPGQWLWMHNRWKQTPSRRVLILSDGKAGHLKQSQALVDRLKEGVGGRELSSTIVEVRYRHPVARWMTLLWSWLLPSGLGGARCLALALTPAAWQALSRRSADVVISCGASLAPVNLLWAGASRAKSLVIMNPAPLPLDRFHLVVAPRHDGLPARTNVVTMHGALTAPLDESRLGEATRRLERHPRFLGVVASPSGRRAVIGVFIGGDSPRYRLSAETAAALVEQVQAVCERLDGWCLVTSSRRTPAAIERLLAERFEPFARCRLLLLAGRDALDGTLEGMLGASDVAIVTGESISMVSEACASGRRVVVMEPMPRRRASMPRKHDRFLRQLAEEGLIRLRPVSDVAQAVEQAVSDGPSTRAPASLDSARDRLAGEPSLRMSPAPKRLDDMARLQDALARLL
jgi:mitochondrial fission protein ELM1